MGLIRVTACLMAFGLAATMTAGGAEPRSERLAFPLEEVSGFDVLNLGHTCVCRSEPEPNVVYPALTSGKPLYGVMLVDTEFANPRSGTPCHFALDESGGTGTGYDRLYVDLNRDGRLSDEAPVAPLRELPADSLFKNKWAAPPVWFGAVTFSSTDAGGTHAVETLPRLVISDKAVATLSFTATKARRGTIQVGRQRFGVTVLNGYPLGTRWDRPATVVRLEERVGRARIPHWIGSDRLMAVHLIDGRYWRFALSPAGDQFFVEPYQGEWGTLRFDLGGWSFRRARFSGSLMAKDKMVAVGRQDQYGAREVIGRCEVPVGDYTLALLDVHYGSLSFNVRGNSHIDDGGRVMNLTYPLQVRRDKPGVLDLTQKAQVQFVAPTGGTRLQRGDELQVIAVLVDPQAQIMISGLRRIAREQASPVALVLIGLMIVGPLGVWFAAGRSRRRYRYLPFFSGIGLLALGGYVGGLYALNGMLHPGRPVYEEVTPQVTITRANGEKVAGGRLPFG